MDAYVKGVLVLVAIAFVVLRFRKKTGNVEASDWREGELEQVEQAAQVSQVEPLVPPSAPASRIRLTDLQETALASAVLGYTIFADGRSLQNPDEVEIYPPRTVDSLVKRGFLESNGSDGYVITQEGRDRLWGR
ncbi:hypothetical protein LOY38_19610 [Pseudomonas sp. B21-015]|uniref:hypothetical protein n=1 Tax=Pseudomonas sp. B21-015 TaxID=2895473 RepID=UPI00215E5C51|nr:hypothetical protein [Pseudomonas sp. B21-015]UVM48577.1 hypothetical protein LOY38_19610 [Pseudomonas sp. B21-015]